MREWGNKPRRSEAFGQRARGGRRTPGGKSSSSAPGPVGFVVAAVAVFAVALVGTPVAVVVYQLLS